MCALKKITNSHSSSNFQKLKDKIIATYNLNRTCQDLDIVRLKNDKIDAIIELKVGKEDNNTWLPYIKKNYPNRPYNKLDDINYLALKELANKAKINLLIFRTKNNSLEDGIKIFQINLLEKDLEIDLLGVYLLEDFINKSTCVESNSLKKRKINNVKDFKNPNFDTENNLYYFISKNEKLKNCYYVERDGIWTMLISNEITLQPIWIYIEFNKTINNDFVFNDENLINEFYPIIDLARESNIPFSIISYDHDLSNIDTYDLFNGIFNKNSYSTDLIESNFFEYYSQKIK
jgi:hypothetical protein